MKRSPIVSVLGHVDHGKSSVLDAIRDTNILATEAGAITQAIGASIIPQETILKKCGDLLDKLNVQLTIPGLLFIDTPGHAAFTSLRKRGGSLADIAVVVVDLNEGFKPQTIEAIEILRANKTPFIIAANKIDLITGFRVSQGPILGTISKQSESIQQLIDTRMYELVGQLHNNFQLSSERFDRVGDFTNQIAIIPISAKTGMGISEVLMVLSALAQKYLENNLLLDEAGPAKGTILEVKEEKGLGKTIDVIVYNGTLKLNDTVVIGGLNEPIVTRVRAMFEPSPLSEMRDKKSRFNPVKQVVAATGVKISCPNIDGVLSGMPIMNTTKENIESTKTLVQEQVSEVLVETDEKGVIIKADNIGSLEALSVLLKDKGFKIRKVGVGGISKKDVTDAESNFETDPLTSVILGFNIPNVPSTEKVKIITSPVIYRIIDEYDKWVEEERLKIEAEKLKGLMRPAKVEFLPNCTFRQSNPAVIGVEILNGTLLVGMPLIKTNGDSASVVRTIQHNKDSLNKAEKGRQVAVSLPHITIGRQLMEQDVLYSDIPEPDFRGLKKHHKLLDPAEVEILKEIAEIKRKFNPMWGV